MDFDTEARQENQQGNALNITASIKTGINCKSSLIKNVLNLLLQQKTILF